MSVYNSTVLLYDFIESKLYRIGDTFYAYGISDIDQSVVICGFTPNHNYRLLKITPQLKVYRSSPKTELNISPELNGSFLICLRNIYAKNGRYIASVRLLNQKDERLTIYGVAFSADGVEWKIKTFDYGAIDELAFDGKGRVWYFSAYGNICYSTDQDGEHWASINSPKYHSSNHKAEITATHIKWIDDRLFMLWMYDSTNLVMEYDFKKQGAYDYNGNHDIFSRWDAYQARLFLLREKKKKEKTENTVMQ